jgi:predicted nucleic-acid-binding Zn-ribbon protein
MVNGDICPHCGSTDVDDGELEYTCENIARVEAGFQCNTCNTMYSVIYKAEKITVIPFDKNFDDLDYDREYEVKL